MKNILLIILILGISCVTENEKICWNFLKKIGLTDAGAAGLMGNLKAESGIVSAKYEHKFKNELKLTDEEYVDQVNKGIYTRFTTDKVGFGLAQWTSQSRKEKLLQACKGKIGDFKCQLEFLMTEFKTKSRFIPILEFLKTSNDVRDCTIEVMLKFEAPKDTSDKKKKKRVGYSMEYYNEFKGTKGSEDPEEPEEPEEEEPEEEREEPEKPKERTYTVVKGDSLYKIAKKFGTTIDTLVRLNGLTERHVEKGQVLRFP